LFGKALAASVRLKGLLEVPLLQVIADQHESRRSLVGRAFTALSSVRDHFFLVLAGAGLQCAFAYQGRALSD
jgi:hypothetical protein